MPIFFTGTLQKPPHFPLPWRVWQPSPKGCLDDENLDVCVLVDEGGELIATRQEVPEPAMMLGLLLLGGLGALSSLKKKTANF